MKKINLGILCAVISISCLFPTFNVCTINAQELGIIYIKVNGLIEPTTASIVCTDGITYTFTDNMNNSIIIQKNNIIIDGAGYVLRGDGTGTGVSLNERSNITIKNTIIEGFYEGIDLSSSNLINVLNNTFNGNTLGLYSHESNNNNITGNIITNNSYCGISLYDASNNIISNNNLTNNERGFSISRYSGDPYSLNNNITANIVTGGFYGILIKDAQNNYLQNNTVSDGELNGITLSNCINSVLKNNAMDDNRWNFAIDGGDPFNDIDQSNTVNGKPMLYWINRHNLTVPDNAGYIALVNCSGIIVQNINQAFNGQGIYLHSTNNSIIKENTFGSNIINVKIVDSNNNSIVNNEIFQSYAIGVCLDGASFDNEVLSNTIYQLLVDPMYGLKGTGIHVNSQSNTLRSNIVYDHRVGISLSGNSNNIIANILDGNLNEGVLIEDAQDNTVSSNWLFNNEYGIRLYVSSITKTAINNILTSNDIESNYWGIHLGRWSSNNTVVSNSVHGNFYGIEFDRSNYNKIYQNSFCINDFHISTYSSGSNLWDNGYPSAGNFWSDYSGVDLYGGAGQDDLGSDGIGDAPYVIDGLNHDNYPLMKPYGTLQTTYNIIVNGETLSVDVISNSTVTGLSFNETSTEFTFTVAGPTGTTGTCNMSVPITLGELFTVTIDGTPISFTKTENSTHYFIYFTYVHSTHVITIKAATSACELELSAGWNMISFSALPDYSSFSDIFAGLSFYQVISWDGSGYVTSTVVEAGVGYWVLVLEETTVTIENADPVTSYTKFLPAGWSMIGSSYQETVNADDVFPGFYQLLTWDGSSYVTSTTIEPGKGYWALVLEPTTINIGE